MMGNIGKYSRILFSLALSSQWIAEHGHASRTPRKGDSPTLFLDETRQLRYHFRNPKYAEGKHRLF
jgi:hypothetical protein